MASSAGCAMAEATSRQRAAAPPRPAPELPWNPRAPQSCEKASVRATLRSKAPSSLGWPGDVLGVGRPGAEGCRGQKWVSRGRSRLWAGVAAQPAGLPTDGRAEAGHGGSRRTHRAA